MKKTTPCFLTYGAELKKNVFEEKWFNICRWWEHERLIVHFG